MARVSSSQAGPASLPQLVERLHAGGSAAVADFSQEDLETVIDDLPLALESESIRDHLPALVGRIDRRLDRTFRRMIEIARQDEERTALLLRALENLAWKGTPTEDEFAWLVQQISRNTDPAGRLAAYSRAATLSLHQAQVAILDALGSIHPDEAIRAADRMRLEATAAPAAQAPAAISEVASSQEAARNEDDEVVEEPVPEPEPVAASGEEEFDPTASTDPGPIPDLPDEPAPEGPVPGEWQDAGSTVVSARTFPPEPEEAIAPTEWQDTGATVVSAKMLPPEEPVEEPAVASEDVPLTHEPSRDEAVIDESQAPSGTWDKPEEPKPDRLTVRTLLRSLEPAANLAAPAAPATAETNGNGNGAEPYPEEETTVADDDEPTPHVENSLTGEGDAVVADESDIADESSSPEAAAAAAAPEPPRQGPITVRTLLASLDTVLLTNSPDESGAPAEPPPAEESPEVWNETDVPPERVTVMTMLRSLETVRVKMAALEDTPPVATPVDDDAAPETSDAEPAAKVSEAPVPAASPEKKPDQPWTGVDLKPLSPPDRARRLAKVRRALDTPELKRNYLGWLLEREKDAFSVVSVRKEILEFGFDRPNFLGFDDATRARLSRWIRERAAADQIGTAAVLAALRRATWAEGEPPQVDEKTRAIVDAATGALSRVPSEERAALYNRDFTAWLFSIREWEDREVLDRYARDPLPGVSEGLFRALAAMDGLSARFGGTGGQSALEIALGLWDRADNDSRTELAKAINEGWSRGLVLDRRSFFDAFWTRYQQHEAQRPAILVALSSFEKEIEKATGAAPAAPVTTAEPAPPARDTKKPAFAPPPTEAPAPAPAKPASFDEAPAEEGSDRFFRMMRKNMEMGMRASAAAAPIVDEDLDDAPVPEEGDAVDSDAVIPDEGDAVLEGSGPKPAEPPRPAAAAPAAKPADSRDEEIVLPNEPLRSLLEYTRFLKALSAGRPIDELLSTNGMDYKQYAACMTAWGRLLQHRPDLALRMGQLLKATS